jgi:Domain of unknown function (DUF1707)
MDVSGRLWPRSDLRVGDADRQGVVAELQRHFVDGRLSSDELAERVSQALNARTFGELAIPLGDLPVLSNPAAPQPPAVGPNDDLPGFTFGPPLGALLVVIGVLAVLSIFVFPTWHGGLLPFWPIFIWGFFFIGRPRRGGRRDRWRRGPPTHYL